MPVTVTEQFKSREGALGANKDSTFLFILEGSDDDVEIKQAIVDYLSTTYGSVYDGMPIADGDIEQHGTQLWTGRVRFAINPGGGNDAFPETGESSHSFETSGSTQHISHSRETMNSYGLAPPDFMQAIGWDGESVEGTDIIVPIYRFEETHYLEAGFATPAYRVLIARLTGSVNSEPFRGFLPGEVLFEGARGSKRGRGDWEITFSFACQPNITGGMYDGEEIRIGGILVTTKAGWDYLWVQYQEQVPAGETKIIPAAESIYIERVYHRADLNIMGLPVPA
jgi:hypothetical protein